jgi:hypothetical protein
MNVVTVGDVNVAVFRDGDRATWCLQVGDLLFSGYRPRTLHGIHTDRAAEYAAVMVATNHPDLRRALGPTRLADLQHWLTEHRSRTPVSA